MRKIELNLSPQHLTFALISIVIVSFFGVIIFASSGEGGGPDAIPSSVPADFSNVLSATQAPQTTANQNFSPNTPVGPNLNEKVSPTPRPSASPSITPSASPTESPSPTPSPTNTPESTSNPTSTPVPSAPANLQGNAGCNGNNPKVDLTWNSANNASTYKIYRNGSVISSDSSGTSYTDTSATVNSQLYFVRAVNSTGESADSNSLSITPNNCP